MIIDFFNWLTTSRRKIMFVFSINISIKYINNTIGTLGIDLIYNKARRMPNSTIERFTEQLNTLT